MPTCDKCGKKINLPFKCKFCGKYFCAEHRLPENHDCTGLEEYKKKAKETPHLIYEPFREENIAIRKYPGRKKRSKRKKISASIKTKIKFIDARIHNITLIIIIFTFLVYFIQLTLPGFTEAFSLDPSKLYEPWRLVTSIFLHSTRSVYHILFNMIMLLFFGTELERRVGSSKFLLVYFSAGIVASLGFVLYSYVMAAINPGYAMIPAIGASGALYGIFATLAIMAPELYVLIFFVVPLKIRHALILFAVIDIVFLPVNTTIANAAHLAGLLAGLYYGFKLKKSRPKTSYLYY